MTTCPPQGPLPVLRALPRERFSSTSPSSLPSVLFEPLTAPCSPPASRLWPLLLLMPGVPSLPFLRPAP